MTRAGNGLPLLSSISWPNGLRVSHTRDTEGRLIALSCGSGFSVECAHDGRGRCVAVEWMAQGNA